MRYGLIVFSDFRRFNEAAADELPYQHGVESGVEVGLVLACCAHRFAVCVSSMLKLPKDCFSLGMKINCDMSTWELARSDLWLL